MKVVALSLLALLGAAPPVTIPVSDKIPVLNVEALCKATVEDDKANGLSDAQSFSDCVRDEMDDKNKQALCGRPAPVMFAINARLRRRRGAAKVTSISSRAYKPRL